MVKNSIKSKVKVLLKRLGLLEKLKTLKGTGLKNRTDTNPKYYGSSFIHSMEEGNEKIVELLQSDKPCMISRFGNTELSTIHYYEENNGYENILNWPEEYKIELNKKSGFFPATNEMLSKFSELFLEHTKNIDLLGVWYHAGEDIIVNKFIPNAFLAPLRSLEPYYFANPWSSKALKNKKILVIHPFAASIIKQYNTNRQKLFEADVLPEFSLDAIPAVQSLVLDNSKFSTWFDAFDFMCSEIKGKDFDIAIIGAGAYGIPLASFVKNIGKKAIHLGGSTQILFGIKGKRWDDHPVISLLYNEYWERPSVEETPIDKDRVGDDGSYW